MISFDKIVNKLYKKTNQIVSFEDIARIFDPDFSKDKKATSRMYKLIYQLKSQAIIQPIRQWVYFINKDEVLPLQTIQDEYYWRVVKKVINTHIGSDWFIGGRKALELLMRDYSRPQNLVVYNRHINKKIRIFDDVIVELRTIFGDKKKWGRNIYATCKTFTKTISLEWVNFRIADIDLAILEALTIRTKELDMYMVTKFLGRYWDLLSRDSLGRLVSIKYITAINRLRSIAKDNQDEYVYSMALDIVKKEWGGCFLTV